MLHFNARALLVFLILYTLMKNSPVQKIKEDGLIRRLCPNMRTTLVNLLNFRCWKGFSKSHHLVNVLYSETANCSCIINLLFTYHNEEIYSV